MKVSFEGIGEEVMTFINDENTPAAAGDMVKLSGNGMVQAAASGSVFCGVCVAGDEDCLSVQTKGVVIRPYDSSAAPAVGYCKLLSAGEGKVMAGDAGREYLVLEVSESTGNVTFVL